MFTPTYAPPLLTEGAVCDLLLSVRLQLTVWLWGVRPACLPPPMLLPCWPKALFVIYCCLSGCSWLFDYGGGVDLHVYPHLCSSLADRSAVCDLLLCVRLQLTVWLWGGGWICMFTPTYAPPSLTEALFVIYCCVSGCSWLFDYGGGGWICMFTPTYAPPSLTEALFVIYCCLSGCSWLFDYGGLDLPVYPHLCSSLADRRRCLWSTVVCPVAADCLTMGGGGGPACLPPPMLLPCWPKARCLWSTVVCPVAADCLTMGGGVVDLPVYPHLCSSLADRSAVCDLLLCVRLQLTVWLWGGVGPACLPPHMLLPRWPKALFVIYCCLSGCSWLFDYGGGGVDLPVYPTYAPPSLTEALFVIYCCVSGCSWPWWTCSRTASTPRTTGASPTPSSCTQPSQL